jgi:hypothetical protein
MSVEEATVRNTYAKLTYASQLGVLVNAVLYDGRRFAAASGPSATDVGAIERELDDQINFDLRDFRVGNISSIRDRELFSLVTLPTSDSFKLTNESLNYSIGSQFSTTSTTVSWMSVRWKAGTETVADNKAVVDRFNQKTFGQLLAMIRGDYSRFASFSVHATLHGKSISYDAIFLFPKNPHERDLWPIDLMAGSELVMFAKTPIYPGVFLETAFREHSAVQAWMDAHRLSSCPEKGSRAVCCDPQKGICGIDNDDLQRAMNVPIDPATRDVFRKGEAQ